MARPVPTSRRASQPRQSSRRIPPRRCLGLQQVAAADRVMVRRHRNSSIRCGSVRVCRHGKRGIGTRALRTDKRERWTLRAGCEREPCDSAGDLLELVSARQPGVTAIAVATARGRTARAVAAGPGNAVSNQTLSAVTRSMRRPRSWSGRSTTTRAVSASLSPAATAHRTLGIPTDLPPDQDLVTLECGPCGPKTSPRPRPSFDSAVHEEARAYGR